MDVVALELIRGIQRFDKVNECVLFAKNGEDRNCIRETEHFRVQTIKGATYADWEQVSLPLVVNKMKLDLLHCTANTAPLICPVPLVVTLHDIIYIEETNFKGSAYQNFGNVYRKFVVPLAIKKAKTIITVSSYEKDVIAEKCSIDPEKIVVIHNGVDTRFHGDYSIDEKRDFAGRYNLPEQFILHLGNTAPKKNTETAITAYIHYCDNVESPLPLVIADFADGMVKNILRRHGRLDLTRNFYLPGYIPNELMPILYSCSLLLLYPSLRESFGMPVLEAMACGIPVVASDIPAIREVGDEAVYFINPQSSTSLAEAMHLLTTDESLRVDYIQKGISRAGLFSWENSTRQLLEVYGNIFNSGSV